MYLRLTPPTVFVDPAALDILSPPLASKISPRDPQILASATSATMDLLQQQKEITLVISPTGNIYYDKTLKNICEVKDISCIDIHQYIH